MQKVVNFIKTTVLGGLVLIVPLAVVTIALGYIFSLLVSLNNAIAEMLPTEAFGHPLFAAAAAVACIVLLCFLAGLLVRTSVGGGLAHRLNELLTDKLPMYGLIKSMTRRFSGDQVLEFTPAEVDIHGSGAISIAFVIEELPDNRYAVFVPSTPAITVGRLYILPKESIKLLDASPRLAMDAVTQWGSGTRLIYEMTESTDSNAARPEAG